MIKSTHTVKLFFSKATSVQTWQLWTGRFFSLFRFSMSRCKHVNLGSFRGSQVLKLLIWQVLLYPHLSCTTSHLWELGDWKLSCFSGSSSTFGAFFETEREWESLLHRAKGSQIWQIVMKSKNTPTAAAAAFSWIQVKKKKRSFFCKNAKSVKGLLP